MDRHIVPGPEVGEEAVDLDSLGLSGWGELLMTDAQGSCTLLEDSDVVDRMWIFEGPEDNVHSLREN